MGGGGVNSIVVWNATRGQSVKHNDINNTPLQTIGLLTYHKILV